MIREHRVSVWFPDSGYLVHIPALPLARSVTSPVFSFLQYLPLAVRQLTVVMVSIHRLLWQLSINTHSLAGLRDDSAVKSLPAVQKTWDRSLGREDTLEEGMATHSSVLAWRVPWTEAPGGLPSTGSQSQTGLKELRGGGSTHSLVTQTVKNLLQCRRPGFDPWVRKIPWRRERLPTPVFLPGGFHGQRSLAGISLGSQRVRRYWALTVSLIKV